MLRWKAMSEAASTLNAGSGPEIDGDRTLLEISEAIAAHHELPALFHSLAQVLDRVVRFDALYLLLYVAERNTMRLHILESRTLLNETEERELPLEQSPGGQVWRTQEPAILTGQQMAAAFPAVSQLVRQHHVESICMLPLTTAQRRLGTMGFISTIPGAYAEKDLAILGQVARQVALAVDNALNYDRVARYQAQLRHERDRLQVLLEITNAVVSSLDLQELLSAISASLRRVVKHDYAGLALLEPDQKRLRLHALDFPAAKGFAQEEMVEEVECCPPGQAVISRKPFIASTADLEQFRETKAVRLHLAEGLKSSVFVPLISRDRVLGTLNIASLAPGAFSPDDVDLLTHAANPIAIAVENALAFKKIAALRDQLEEEKLYLEDEIQTDHNFEEIVGESAALRRTLKQVETVAPTESSVLLLGETGTGKELIARAVHNLSGRRDRALVKVNCAAIPSGLLESELFGHERGAFTGAIAQKIGRFELANRGTLFLDEIGDIPLELQPKLLRVLQEHEFERLGSSRTLHVDVRVIAATNQNLAQMVEERQFRSDLFYRLNVFPISVPALRERPDDIPELVRYFTQKYARQMNKRIETIPADAMESLRQYHWPGNVRELENLVERAVILTEGSVLRVPLSEIKPARELGPGAVTLEDAEREHILRALQETNWVVGGPRGAAARLGMKRTTLQSKMSKLKISK
jgi:formate hydrogenlyase transcriptional activator